MGALTLALVGCGSDSQPVTLGNGTLSAKAAVGKELFFDVNLSGSGQQACASCHDPDHAYGAPNTLSVQLGGVNLDKPGLRNSPTLTYSAFIPSFSFASDGTPTGGFFHDGRSGSLADQATHPFLNEFEMANASAADLQTRLLTRPYIGQFRAVFGDAVLKDPDSTLKHIGEAIAAFELEDTSFHRFNSKFDAVTQGKAQLTAQEANGFALFNNPNKGNCAACHVSAGVKGVPALFTDHTYDNIGVPRNWDIPANSDSSTLSYVPQNGAGLGAPNHNYYDMGLCGPLRTDLAGNTTTCGQFKVPSLRNVSLKGAIFHNGIFHNLQDAVSFYITRESNPTRWYVQADGTTPDIKYNDLPVMYDANVNVLEAPYNPATAPTLTDSEIKDVVAFLCTLADGYDPANPQNYANGAQCRTRPL